MPSAASITPLRLLPLASLVAFPHTPAYTLTAAGVEHGSRVGLIHAPQPLDAAPSTDVAATFASVGLLAEASVVERYGGSDGDGDLCLISCAPIGRFNVVRHLEPVLDAAGNQLHLADTLTLSDDEEDPLEAEESEALQRQCSEMLRELLRLRGTTTLPPLLSTDDGDAPTPEAFSLALAGTLELDLAEAQSMLEGRSSAARLRRLRERLEEGQNFAAAQAALRALGDLGGGLG